MRTRFSANYKRDTRACARNVSTPPSQPCWEALYLLGRNRWGLRSRSPLPPLFLLRGRKKYTLIGESSFNDRFSGKEIRATIAPGMEKFDSKRFNAG